MEAIWKNRDIYQGPTPTCYITEQIRGTNLKFLYFELKGLISSLLYMFVGMCAQHPLNQFVRWCLLCVVVCFVGVCGCVLVLQV